MIKIRPHHLLCLQAWRGHGYDVGFTENMNAVAEVLSKGIVFELVSGSDDICAACPNDGVDGCSADRSGISAEERDERVRAYFGLIEGVYDYRSLIVDMLSKSASVDWVSLCGDCSWWPHGWCAAVLTQKGDVRPCKNPE